MVQHLKNFGKNFKIKSMKVSFNNPILLIPISDLVAGITKIKRKAQLNFLLYHPANKQLTVSVQVFSYAANEDDSYGAQFDESLIKSYETTFVAKIGENLVDVSNGFYLCDSNNEYLPDTQTSEPVLNPALAGKNYAEEFDFFNNIANTEAVIINDMIKNFVLFADSQGRFNK
jgi:hypothetical protein